MLDCLTFLEQVENYSISPDEKILKTADINKARIDYVEGLFNSDEFCSKFIQTFVTQHNFLGKFGTFQHDAEYWRGTKLGYARVYNDMGVLYPENNYDFMNELMQSFIYYDWRYHKLSYKVSKYLGERLMGMDAPEDVLLKNFLSFPARTFYIDLSEIDCSPMCEDLAGIFVISDFSEDSLYLEEVYLIKGREGRVMPLFHSSRIILGSDRNPNSRVIFEGKSKKGIYETISFEDGIYRKYSDYNCLNFIVNFLIYLNAANKDVEKNPIVAKNFEREVSRKKPVKNKFREMREYEVGYRLSTPYPKKSSVKTNSLNTEANGSPKSPHYRSAHWHHYWVGHGSEKELVVKWVDGVFVNGKAEQKVPVIHKVT